MQTGVLGFAALYRHKVLLKFNIQISPNKERRGEKCLKYCPNCGTVLQPQNQKFCSECGVNLQTLNGNSIIKEQASKKNQTSVVQLETENEENIKPIKLNSYDLGIRLENTTASILEKMGYAIEKRKKMPTKSGAIAEIDILITRGNRRRAVECKNYDPSKSVGISDMRVFKDKLTDIGVMSGIFVTNTYFSEDAQKLAESVGIELWDDDIHKEKFYAYAIGRIKNPSLVNDPVLPLKADFLSVSSLTLRNNQSIRLFSAVLLYQPYIVVKYRLQAKRSDPTGKVHSFSDFGTYFVDALDGDIINQEKGIVGNFVGLFKSKEEKVKSKEDAFVSEDLESIASVTKPILSSSDYQVSVADTIVSEEDATKIVKAHVIDRNAKKVQYNVKVRGEIETRSFNFVPRLKEINIRGVTLVYVPKWNLEYEAGVFSFSRRFLGSSGRSLEDDLAKCHKCILLKKDTVAVCEICGLPLCQKQLNQQGKFL